MNRRRLESETVQQIGKIMRRITMSMYGITQVTAAAARSVTLQLTVVSAITALIFLGGCAYKLDGKVIDGFGSVVMGRDKDPDARKSGIGGATVELIRDAGTMNRAVAARATSGSDGRFILEVPAFGAGWMDESWQIRVRRHGFENVESEVQLPSSTSGRLMIVEMHAGKSAPFREPDSSRSMIDEAKAFEPSLGNINP